MERYTLNGRRQLCFTAADVPKTGLLGVGTDRNKWENCPLFAGKKSPMEIHTQLNAKSDQLAMDLFLSLIKRNEHEDVLPVFTVLHKLYSSELMIEISKQKNILELLGLTKRT